MLNKFRKFFKDILELLAGLLGKMGFTPNSLTLAGLALMAVASLFIVEKRLIFALIFVLVGSLFDALDGSLARLQGKVTRLGGVLDSVVDRYEDALLIASIWFSFGINPVIGFFVLAGSLITSYSRARLEVEGVKGLSSVGLIERPERLIILIVCIAIPSVSTYLFILLAILSNVTVFQRILYGRKAIPANAA